MPRKTPKMGSGQFQWNLGGWFGSQIGGTVWMVILGVMMLFQVPLLGATALIIAATVNGLGCWLWSRRNQFEPYPSIQGLLVAVGLATFLLLLTYDLTGHLSELDPHFRNNPKGLYTILLMFPVLMGMFHFQNRTGKK